MSLWWLLVAFILGAYAGAILVGLMSMAARNDEDAAEARGKSHARGERPRRRRHGAPVEANS